MNYVYCNKCLEYVPLWHPGAIRFYSEHGSCVLGSGKRYFINGTEVPCVGEPPLASALSSGENYPEGYKCSVGPMGPMEELAFSCRPGQDRLT